MQFFSRTIARLSVVVFLGFTGLMAAPAAAQVCTGDCNSDHRVVVSELVTGVNIALTSSPVAPCLAMDVDSNGRVAVNELVAAVTSLLRGCPATFTPSPTSTFTRTSTPTVTHTPTLTATRTPTGPPVPTSTPSVTRTPSGTFTPTSSTPSATPTPTIEPLTLTVQVNPDPVAPGETMLAAITVTNRRNIALANLVVQGFPPLNGVATFGAGFTSSGGTCAGAVCRPGQPITWNLGMLPAGSARTVTAPITVLSGATAPADGTTLTVHATATADSAGSLAADGITTVESGKILALGLDADVDAVPPGETLRYTLSFGNRSAQLQMDGTLTMPVPAGTTFESASGGGIETSGSVVWALGNLAPGDSGLRDVVVRINDTVRQGQTVTAEATLTAGSAMAEAQAITHVQTAAALTARIDVGPDPVVPGETLLVSLTVTNRGPVDLFSVMAAVRMPAEIAGFGVGFASDGPACSGAFCDFPERVIWTLGTLAAGQGITVTMPATVNSGASAPLNGALIVFDGDAIANDGSETRARRSVRVRASRALELEMDVDPQPVRVGKDLHYRLTFGNRGTGLLQGTLLEMAVPAGTTFQSASDDGVETSGRVRWTLGALAPGASGVRELVVAVDAGVEAGEPITAEGTVTSGAVSARAQAITLIEGDAPLQIVVAAGPNPVEPSEALLVSLTVTNRGLVELTGVVAALRMPAELAGFGVGFASDAATCSGAFCDFPERVVWNLGTLPAGQGVTVTMPGVVNAVATTPGGTVIVLDADASDSTGRKARARHSVAVRPARALELELEAGPQPVSTGGELRYRLTFGNRGIGLLQATALAMPVPEGTTFLSASDGGLEVSGTVHWPFVDLAPGVSGVREMVVQVNAGVGEPIAVEAAATSGILTARAQAVTQVEADLPLTLELSAGPDPIAPGETLLVSLTATNRGLVDLPNVVAAVRMPAELAGFGVGFASDGPACSGAFCDFPERVVWDLGTVPAGQGVTVTMPGTVNAVATTPGGTVIVLDADASADGDKRVRARHNIAVQQTRAMELEIEARPQPVSASEDLHYTLTFGNRGIGLLQNALLEIPVPAGTTFQSASDAGTETGGIVQWSLGDLAPGASGVRELVVQVDANAGAGEPITANARVTSSTVTAHAQTVTQVEVDAPLTISLTTAPDPVAPSETLLVSLTVTNRGLVDLFAVTAAVRMPAELAGFGSGFASNGAACSGAFCDFPERVIWNLGTLATGRGITVTMPGFVNAVATTPSGTVIVFDGDASANDGSKARARHNLVVQASRPLELELATSPAPAGAGELIGYTLTFGNRSAAVGDDAVIEMPVPLGTTFQSASDGGVEADGVVEWSLGDLPPGASGTRQLVVQVDATAGEAVFAAGRLIAGAREARTHAVTQVQENVPLSVSLTASPDPAMPGMAVLMSLMVTNTGPVALFGVTAGIRVPQEVSGFSQNLTTGGGACSGAFCDTPERVVWTLGTAGMLGAGQSVTVTMPPPIPGGGSAPVDGTVILFDADVSANDGNQARARYNVRVQ